MAADVAAAFGDSVRPRRRADQPLAILAEKRFLDCRQDNSRATAVEVAV